MSTRSTVYYEDGGVHVFYDGPTAHIGMWLEYREGAFDVIMPLSVRLSTIIQYGLAAEKKNLARARKVAYNP